MLEGVYMNREILFKAKRKDNNEWIEGNLVYIKCDNKYYIIPFSTNVYNENKFGDIKELDIVEVIPETVCQYTGLNDKNGKKIFENDIVKGIDYKFIVKWNKNRMAFELFTFMKEIDEGIPINVKEFIPFEVIGTKFDDGELIC